MAKSFLSPVKGQFSKRKFYDYNLLAVIIILICFGLVMLYSTTAYTAEMRHANDMYFFLRQLRNSAICVAFAILLSVFADYHILWKLSGAVYIVAIILMALVRFSPLGIELNGSKRWLNLGIQFQPSEIAKLAVICFIPVVIIKMGKNFRGFKSVAVTFLLGAVQGIGAYVLTDNLSTGIIITAITVIIIFAAHPKTWPFLLTFAVMAAAVFIFVFAVKHMDVSSGSFRMRRIMIWLDPEKYQSSGGYQIMQGLYALGSGGFFGKGLGNSTQKMGFLPEAENDMIFSIICEELGIFGALIVIVLFGYLIYRLFFISRNANDKYGSLMACGIFSHIALQVILNICVVTNIIPTTGITLPFISYGGTSILFLMLEMAVALAISRDIIFRRREVDMWGDIIDDYDYQ